MVGPSYRENKRLIGQVGRVFANGLEDRGVKYCLADNMGQGKNATVPSQSDAPEESDL